MVGKNKEKERGRQEKNEEFSEELAVVSRQWSVEVDWDTSNSLSVTERLKVVSDQFLVYSVQCLVLS